MNLYSFYKYIGSIISITLICMVIPMPLQSQGQIHIPSIPSGITEWVSGQIVLKLNQQTAAALDTNTARSGQTGITRLDQLGQQLKVRSLKQRFPFAEKREYKGREIDLSVWYKVTFSDSVPVDMACELYLNIPGILAAQPIGIHGVDVIPNDGFFGDQWHLQQSADHDIDAPEAWDLYSGNPEIIVGMLDSGVRFYHRDLGGANASYASPQNSQGNMWINTAESAVMGNDSDDDSNGYTDDWIGWDFVTGVSGGGGFIQIDGEDYDNADNDPSDFNGHGTHCAGNISAINNNGYASASAAGGWGDGTLQATSNGVRVMALRIGYSMRYQGQERGFVQMDFAAEALYYAANNGARIVSCSWGSSNSGGIADAIDYFLSTGGMIFKSAGNSGNSSADYICGRGDNNIICVAATDSFDVKASFSNYGNWVDISAPGVDILSSYHVHSDPQNDYVATLSGTSMATPIAASCAALIWGANPNLTADVVRQILFNNTDNIDSLNTGYEGLLGVGRVNAYMPLLDTSLPVELGSFTAGWDSGAVRLEWETFSELENLGFEIYRRTGEEGTYQMIASFKDEISLQGLGNSSTGRSYYYIDNNARSGFLYSYILYDVDYSGMSTAHGPVVIDLQDKYHDGYLAGNKRGEYILHSNYPNPFNPFTRIDYQLPRSSAVNLSIYNLQGQKIATLVSEVQNEGQYQVEWDASGFSSGVYFYRIEVADPANLKNEFRDMKKMIFLK